MCKEMIKKYLPDSKYVNIVEDKIQIEHTSKNEQTCLCVTFKT